MNKKIQITINGGKISCLKEQTILDVAKEHDIEIPTLCFHSDLTIQANCRLCLVEIKGRKGLHTSCSTKVEPEMNIITNSTKITKARKINLELLSAQHNE